MREYQEIVDRISTRTGTTFGAASPGDLSALRALGVSKPILDFYAAHEPSECAEGQVRLWPITAILQENSDLVPGAYIAPLGYIVFATTFCGDTYCFDHNRQDENGEPRVVLFSHEVVGEDITAEEAFQLAKPISTNLHEFLQQFARDEIDEECIY
ncbi:MAG: SMI1/KNR4 family protein [Pirellulales bacterium]